MYFRITAESAELVDPHDTTAFHAVCPADLSRDELAATVRRAELGDLLPDGEHVLVRVDAIRRMATDRVGPGWPDDLAAMLRYASAKGWTDDIGDRVRAHVVRE